MEKEIAESNIQASDAKMVGGRPARIKRKLAEVRVKESPPEEDLKAIELVKRSYTYGEGHAVVDALEFLGGTLRIVAYSDEDGDQECYVFADGKGKSILLADITEIAFRLGHPRMPLIERLLHFIGIPGLLGLSIVLAMLLLILTDREPPEMLQHSLAAVLGFFFGTKSNKTEE